MNEELIKTIKECSKETNDIIDKSFIELQDNVVGKLNKITDILNKMSEKLDTLINKWDD